MRWKKHKPQIQSSIEMKLAYHNTEATVSLFWSSLKFYYTSNAPSEFQIWKELNAGCCAHAITSQAHLKIVWLLCCLASHRHEAHPAAGPGPVPRPRPGQANAWAGLGPTCTMRNSESTYIFWHNMTPPRNMGAVAARWNRRFPVPAVLCKNCTLLCNLTKNLMVIWNNVDR